MIAIYPAPPNVRGRDGPPSTVPQNGVDSLLKKLGVHNINRGLASVCACYANRRVLFDPPAATSPRGSVTTLPPPRAGQVCPC